MKIIQTISNFVLFVTILLAPIIAIYKLDKIEAKITRPVVYQVDNAGAMMVGTVTSKEIIDGKYIVTISAYGKFLVTEEQYNSIEIGDDMPEFLKWRGN